MSVILSKIRNQTGEASSRLRCLGNSSGDAEQKDKTYFLSYRDAAKVCSGLSHREAHTITFGLRELGVIEIVRKGQPGLNSREAAEFRYLLPPNENGAEEDAGFDL